MSLRTTLRRRHQCPSAPLHDDDINIPPRHSTATTFAPHPSTTMAPLSLHGYDTNVAPHHSTAMTTTSPPHSSTAMTPLSLHGNDNNIDPHYSTTTTPTSPRTPANFAPSPKRRLRSFTIIHRWPSPRDATQHNSERTFVPIGERAFVPIGERTFVPIGERTYC